MSPLQYSSANPVCSAAEMNGSSVGIKLPTIPAKLSYSSPLISSGSSQNEYNCQISEIEPQKTSNADEKVLVPSKSIGQLNDLNFSAFRGITPDPFKNAMFDMNDPQLLLFKRIIDSGLSATMISQQILVHNQQLQFLLHSMKSSEPWRNLLSQQAPFIPAFPTPIPGAIISNASPTGVLQNGFTSPSVKQESPMFV